MRVGNTPNGAAHNDSGFVYFLRAKGFGSGLKIGFSKKPEARLHDLKSEVGVPLILVKKIRATLAHEQALHYVLHYSRCHGEWYYFKNEKRVHIFLDKIISTGKFPSDLFKNRDDYRAFFSGSRNICACGKINTKPKPPPQNYAEEVRRMKPKTSLVFSEISAARIARVMSSIKTVFSAREYRYSQCVGGTKVWRDK